MSRTGTPTKKKRKRKTPWLRRIVSTLILLALLAGIIFLAVKAVTWVGTFFQSENQKIKDQVVQQPVSYSQCKAEDVDVVLTPSATAFNQGDTIKIGVSFENKGEDPCTITPGDLQFDISVGGEVIWDPVQCWPDWAAKQLLLAPNQPWSTEFVWDGYVYVGCEAHVEAEQSHPTVAGAGVYDLRYSLLGSPGTTTTQLVVQ